MHFFFEVMSKVELFNIYEMRGGVAKCVIWQYTCKVNCLLAELEYFGSGIGSVLTTHFLILELLFPATAL